MDGWKPIIPEADLLKAEVEVWKRNCETLTEEIDQTSRELHTVIEAKFGDSCLYDALRIVNRRFYARIQATDGGLAKIEQLGRELTIAKEKIAALEAENAALRANNQTLDQVMSDIALDLGCACDNESILEAIHALRQRLVVDDAMVKRAEIAWAMAFYRERYRESSSYRCMRAALTAALANKDEPK